MTPLYAVILGVLEGITEFLPVSSTGHLILAQAVLGMTETEFSKLFSIVIQLAAIMAVIGIYIRYLIKHPRVLVQLTIAFLPTGVVGLILYPVVKLYFLGNVPLTIGALILGGIALIVFDRPSKRDAQATRSIETLTVKQALGIGLFQTLSIVPGVSRAAATIIGGLHIGLSRKDAVQFSFLLAIPTMIAAAGFDLLKNYSLLTAETIPILGLGMLCSFITAWLAVSVFLRYIERHTLRSFGIYRILLGLSMGMLFFGGIIQ